MGMDVYGRDPTGESGEYFRCNMSAWTDLANLVISLCPDETDACKDWYTNDGDGLDAGGARALAEALTEHIQTGRVREYITQKSAQEQSYFEENVREFTDFLHESGGFRIW